MIAQEFSAACGRDESATSDQIVWELRNLVVIIEQMLHNYFERQVNRMLRQRAIKYAIYPTDEQKELLCKTFGCVRFVWNQMLSDYEEFLAATGKVFVPTPAKYKSVNEFLKEPDNILLQLRYGLWHGSRVFFHLIAEAVSMGAQWTDKKHIVVQFVLVGHAYPHSGSFPKAHVCSNVIVTYQC